MIKLLSRYFDVQKVTNSSFSALIHFTTFMGVLGVTLTFDETKLIYLRYCVTLS
jgi:hypothetical protein